MNKSQAHLLAALRGCRADAFGPVQQADARADLCLVVGARHLVLLALPSASGERRARADLARVDGRRPLVGPGGIGWKRPPAGAC